MDLEPLLQRTRVFNGYFDQLGKWLPLSWHQSHYALLVLLLPAIAPILLVQFVSGQLFGMASMIIDTTILLYCLGPEGLYYQSAPNAETFFKAVHKNLLTVLFWFAVLGPAGALLFRLVERLTTLEASTVSLKLDHQEIQARALPVEGGLSWLPIRFFTGIQVIFGHFPDTLRYWLDYLITGWSANDELAATSGRIALNCPQNTLLESSQYKQALHLLDKMLGVFLGMLLLYTLLSAIAS